MVKASSSEPSAQETATRIKSLLKEISKDERADAARLDELRQILASLIQQGDLSFSKTHKKTSSNKKKSSSATDKWNGWLQKQHQQTVTQLTSRIEKGRRTAVRTLWGLMAASPTVTPKGQHVHLQEELLGAWLAAVVQMPVDVRQDKPLKHLIEAEWMQRDVQYYALRCIAQWATDMYKTTKGNKQQEGSLEQADRMLYILMMIPFPTTQSALDMPGNKHLFPPPESSSSSKNNEKEQSYEDASDDEDSQEEQGNNSSDEEEDAEDSDDDKEKELPPKKKQRHAPKYFAYQDVKYHKKALAKAWMAILRLPLSTASLKKALPYLSQHVLPKIQQPLRFADLFIKAYRGATGSDDTTPNKTASGRHQHANTIIPLLALDGLFYLMTQHQLEYPHFYTQLYAILKPKLFYVKYRARFFALLQKCLLRNEMLPAHLVAAFLKRMLQCALQVPPPGALFVLALCSNLLRQHEECAALIHRNSTQTSSTTKDPYNADTDDPVQSHALQSSLWELHALEQHYLPAVSTLAASIGREDFKSPMLQLDEMAQHSYASLIAQERNRRKNSKGNKSNHKNTPVTFTKPASLFCSSDIFAGILHVPEAATTEGTNST
ncbi:Nucleolar complex protein 4 homolog [Seminavis robusta]|uniref:Nucleolar complex protein 4 homolog n=1 Tax=Seminavis robusta TaxID=568900 RepID=A0A9N8E475_9STRA|nr:Nucleolar complex protein 4 homolog [Seminavis robusta]|eukprot:Sro631_g178450.1 Nucleolar complex protein 4 homolog (607) ;mRNA; f:15408-17228